MASSAPSTDLQRNSAPPTNTELLRCKAVDQSQRVTLLSLNHGIIPKLVARDGYLYYVDGGELMRVPRDGSKPTMLGRYRPKVRERQRSVYVEKCLVLGDSVAVFCVNRNLVSIPLTGGEAVELATDFSQVIALRKEYAYGVRCNLKEGVDELVRVGLSGGATEVVGSWPRKIKGSSLCNYVSVAVDDNHAFISEQTPGRRRLFSISLREGALRELTTGVAWPSVIELQSESVVYSCESGIFRLQKSGGKSQRLTQLGLAPFSSFALGAEGIYVLEAEAYASTAFIKKVPLSGGNASVLDSFSITDVTQGFGLSNIVVDDSCVYYVQSAPGSSGTKVFARPK